MTEFVQIELDQLSIPFRPLCTPSRYYHVRQFARHTELAQGSIDNAEIWGGNQQNAEVDNEDENANKSL